MNIFTYIAGALIALFGILFKVKDFQLKSEKNKNNLLNSQLANSEKTRKTQQTILQNSKESTLKTKEKLDSINANKQDLIDKVSDIQNNKEMLEDEKQKEEINMANTIYNNFNNSSRL